ncbi:hypothetical protein ACTMTJ_09495 [Phytohabitans sp. LJ34]|uniref:hypothetical protein n=1 Tax=Phytohabitans sp. LJ34 TaxID=3452217 RepID=UPI003F89A217
MFALLALVSAVITDLYDRDFPQAIGVESRLGLDFGDSRFTPVEAFAYLEELDARLGLGLVRVVPDLDDEGGQVYIALNSADLPAEFRYFGEGVGKVVGKERLAHSYPDGTYLVTGDRGRLGEFEDALRRDGVSIRRSDASVADSLRFVVKEASFFAAVLAAFALIAALALYWLSMKARGRALRVLGGCPTARIQMQDLGGFLGALVVSAVAVALAAAACVGVLRGWMYVGSFLKALAGLEITVIVASLLAALAMSASAWPSATILATRQPAAKSLRLAAIVIQAATFVLVVATAGPAWSALERSSAIAAEMAQWRKLSDQVGLAFVGTDDEMTGVEPQIGQLVKEAESLGSVAYSYAFTPDSSADFGGYSAVAFVNQRWLDLMTRGARRPAVAHVPYRDVQEIIVPAFADQFALWSRSKAPGEAQLAQLRFVRPVEGFRLPVATGGGGDLRLMDDVLVAVMPSLYEAIDDSNLTSMISTHNIVFTGVAATQKLLERHRLTTPALRVVYIAEEGIIQARFAAYVVWLRSLALAALAAAFTVAAAVSALITALLHAKRDFPLRAAGQSWALILRRRVAKELLAGLGLTMIVLLFQKPDAIGAILVAAALGLLVPPLGHLFSAQWCFAGVGRRRI